MSQSASFSASSTQALRRERHCGFQTLQLMLPGQSSKSWPLQACSAPLTAAGGIAPWNGQLISGHSSALHFGPLVTPSCYFHLIPRLLQAALHVCGVHIYVFQDLCAELCRLHWVGSSVTVPQCACYPGPEAPCP